MEGGWRRKQMRKNSAAAIYSIGHSNHGWPEFLALLRAAGISAIADVRTRPYSGRQPHFNRPELERALAEQDIAYVFLGHQLGGRPEDEALYDADGRVNYERLRQTKPFHEGLRRLQEGLENYRIALLCSEEDPLDCHRGLMIAPALLELGLFASHIRGDGKIESQHEMEDRLFAETGVGDGFLDGLFAAQITPAEREGLLAEAYAGPARRRAFRVREEVE